MRLYIMRHGEAAQAGSDAARPLSARGRAEAVKVANFLLNSGSPVEGIWHSPLARAVETAALVERTLGQPVPLETRTDLVPNASAEAFFDQYRIEERDNLLLVSHLPFVDNLLSLLATGGTSSTFLFKPAALAALEGSLETGFSIAWAVHPACLP